MWEMYTFVHKYILPLSKPFEIFMTSLGTQIMLPSQFVEFLDHTKTLLQLLYHKHEIRKSNFKNFSYTSVTVDILFEY